METTMPDLTCIMDLMYKKSGMVFSSEKSYIILTKLQPLIAKYNLDNMENLLFIIKNRSDVELINEIIDILTVNETSFYRDRYPFEILHSYVIPYILQNNSYKKEVKILCAACSTGQEPYSIAMHFLEHKEYGLDFKLTAIDLSPTAINQAKSGIYNQFEIQRGLPMPLLLKYFTQTDKMWTIGDVVKQYITFHQFNLKDSLSSLGKFDIVLCRNVLIYFDEGFRKQVIDNLKQTMNQGAILMLGGTELVSWKDDELKEVTSHNGVYLFNKK